MTTTASTTKPDQPVGLYLLNLEVGRVGVPGSPVLKLGLLVNAPTGSVTGHGDIVQAIAPPGNDIGIADLKGELVDLSTDPAVQILTLTGSWSQPFPPPAIGTMSMAFRATLQVPHGAAAGRGSFTYGENAVKDVPVTVLSS